MLISFGLHFNAAIAAVAYPASEAQFLRPAAARRPVAHTLHPPANRGSANARRESAGSDWADCCLGAWRPGGGVRQPLGNRRASTPVEVEPTCVHGGVGPSLNPDLTPHPSSARARLLRGCRSAASGEIHGRATPPLAHHKPVALHLGAAVAEAELTAAGPMRQQAGHGVALPIRIH